MAESMRGMKRTCRCAELSEKNIGEEVTMMGWVQKQRNKGGIIFVDMRDRSGILQVIFEDGEINADDFAKAEKLRSEFVIAVKGKVTARSGAVNENLATGAIELRAEELRVLSESDTPPFPIEADSKTKEELRLKYRYLDLRRPDLQRNLIMRSKVATLIRQFLADEGFLEIETPMLTKSTPEGARDYLVPSRVHPGTFYALPQSPQLFKQLLMCSGYDRYFQLARCFRDEDLRADRQPEFTQVDMELSFVDIDDVIDVNERLLQALFKEILNIPEGYSVLFLGGGASMQFCMVPYNFLEKKAAYLNTGVWAKKAMKEAKGFGEVVEVASSADANYTFIPKDFTIPADADYFHVTTNNTIYGTELKGDLDSPVPMVADMSSDIFSRPVDVSKYICIYGGAQKNLAPSGVTFVIVKDDAVGVTLHPEHAEL